MTSPTSNNVEIGITADFNRKLIEKKGTKSIVLDHHSDKHDSLYERDSGLNHVLCRLAKKKSVSFIVDLNELNISNLKTRAEILARIIQNIRLFRKFKNDFKILPSKGSSQKDFLSLLLVLGVPTDRLREVTK